MTMRYGLPPGWELVVEDVRATTGLALHLEEPPGLLDLMSDEEGYVEASLDDDFRRAGFLLWWDDPEEALAELVDKLQESFLHEAIWGGWPICPAHGTHPLEPVLREGVRWTCPRGSFEAPLGELAVTPPS